MIRIPQEDLTFIRVLGKGGCGEVHLAESKTLGKVAVKKTLLGGEELIMQEFLNEAELLSKLNSPYIIRFFGTLRNKEGECIVMEYATNGTLFHFLELLRKRNIESTFPWDKRYQMAQDITRGLLLMHSQGVLHRDMKSLNILLDQNMTAKISDFGLSKIKTKSQTTSSNLYVQNNVFGSLLWKAPETFSIKNPFTDKADIYALGIVFWEIASCQVPYEGFDAETIKDSVKSGERLDIPLSCPVEFKELIELCWNQEHKQRPTASIVFDKISQIIGQIQKNDYENITSSVPQLAGSIPDPVITFPGVQNPNIIGSDQKRLVTEKDFNSQKESEIERKGVLSLHYEVYSNNIENVKYLLSKGVDVNLVNEYGCTPLHYACSLGFLDLVNLLISHKADITKRDIKSLTPLDYAKNQGFIQIQQLLERKMIQITSVPQLSGSIPDPVITFPGVPNMNLIFTGSTPNPIVTDNQSVQNNEESEIERKIKLAHEKQQFLLLQKKKNEEEEQKRKLDEIEKENQRIEKEMKEEQENKMKAEEERKKREEEERKREEQERKKKEEEERKKKDEEEMLPKKKGDPKQNEEYERIGRWRTTQPPDFDNNIRNAAQNGKLSSVVYLLAHGTSVNSKDSSVEYLYLI